MSTWWHFECLSHEPPLVSADEFTQHTDDYAFRKALELAASRPMPADWDDRISLAEDYFTRNAVQFLVAHPDCQLGIVSEYGEHRAVANHDETAGGKTNG